jgi:hypothetical protein
VSSRFLGFFSCSGDDDDDDDDEDEDDEDDGTGDGFWFLMGCDLTDMDDD